jgi:hypothetical protein
MTQQSTDMLKQQLADQIGFLKRSTEEYDKGTISEAKRLATTIRLLVHHTPTSHSLLDQLGMKSLQFLDTTFKRPSTHSGSYAGLVGVLMGAGDVKYQPHLDRNVRKLVSFNIWWSGIVIIDSRERNINRKKLVLAVANQDGGAHVDPKLDTTYADLSQKNSMQHMAVSETSEKPMTGIEYATIRQIAHEMLCTLDPTYTTPSNAILKAGFSILGFELVSSSDEK